MSKISDVLAQDLNKCMVVWRKVPMVGEERMRGFPRLVCQEFELRGLGHYQAVADIKMSSAGTEYHFSLCVS